MIRRIQRLQSLACYAAAVALGEERLQVLTILSSLTPVEGRFQFIKTEEGTIGIVDYAHTPDALLRNVLTTIANIRTGNETLITLVGCGGDRDKEKRPVMATVAAEMSDKVISLQTIREARIQKPSFLK